jgi:hypothetical protein
MRFAPRCGQRRVFIAALALRCAVGAEPLPSRPLSPADSHTVSRAETGQNRVRGLRERCHLLVDGCGSGSYESPNTVERETSSSRLNGGRVTFGSV